MRKLFVLILVASLPLFAAANEGNTQHSEKMTRFGEGGDLLPASARELLSEDFFSQNLIRAVADGRNYSSVIDVGESVRQAADHGESLRLFLRLDNPGETPNDIVLSVPDTAAAARNFIFRVEPGSSRAIDVSELEAAASVYLLSLQRFSARLEIESAVGVRRVDAEVLAPAVAEKSDASASSGLCRSQPNYCTECEENIQLCSGGSCVFARAVRTFWYSAGGNDYYRVNVHYPVSGPIFHCHWSTFSSAGSKKSCQAVGYTTFRPATAGVCTVAGSTAHHSWSYLDDTLYFGTTSSVSCTSGCSQSWTVTRF